MFAAVVRGINMEIIPIEAIERKILFKRKQADGPAAANEEEGNRLP
jgi:hypothetical protein